MYLTDEENTVCNVIYVSIERFDWTYKKYHLGGGGVGGGLPVRIPSSTSYDRCYVPRKI